MKHRPIHSNGRSKNAADADVALIRELRAVFRDVHRHGVRALRANDYKTFGDAIAIERSLIREQRDAIRARIGDLEKRRAVTRPAKSSARSRRRAKR